MASHIQYKLCTPMFYVQHGMAPMYLSQGVNVVLTLLHSGAQGYFVTPRPRLYLSDKLFSEAGQQACNSLLTDIRTANYRTTFCHHLKTFHSAAVCLA